MSRILIIEDEVVIRRALKKLLERNHHEVFEADSVSDAVNSHDLAAMQLIITDLRLPGAPGTDIITKAENIPVLVMTSYASVRSAVESMKLGAIDYIAKPFDHDEMLMLVDRILKQSVKDRRTAALETDLERCYPIKGARNQLIGETAIMKKIFHQISRLAETDTTVLITGESGTGKELVARILHSESPRASGPFITVNCAAIPENTIESELFGYVKGAFQGADENHAGLVEAGEGGILFLDEVAGLSTAAQNNLLRVLTDGEIRPLGSPHSRRVSVRIIASSQKDLRHEVEEGRFRQDLYYRLQVMEINLPPLRERKKDIPLLAEKLVEKICHRLNRATLSLNDEIIAPLIEHPWLGNVRELENTIERAVILSEDGTLSADIISLNQASGSLNSAKGIDSSDSPTMSLEDYFRHFVTSNQNHMTETELSERLGISRKALWERRQRLGIERPKASAKKRKV